MIADKIKNLKGSPTLTLAAKAGELKAAGEDVISLSVGEPDWDTFDSIKSAAKAAMDEGKTKYTPVGGTPELRKAIAVQTSEDLSLEYEAANVTVSSGGKFVIYSAFQTLLNPGDEVLIPSPYWVSYPDMVTLVGGAPKVVTTKAENGFKMTADELKAAITDKTKILVLNSPSNPTGEIYTAEELSGLGEVLKQNPHVMVLSDDIYNRLVFDGGLAPHILQSTPELKERTLAVNGISKTYSMTGWRLGWAVGPKEVIAAMSRFQSQTTSCASSISQAAAVAAIQDGQQELKETLKMLKQRRDFVYQGINNIEGIEATEPQGAFYIWPDVSSLLGKSYNGKKLESAADFSQALLEAKMVVAVPGTAFGQDGRLRVSYALGQERM
ncbi:MAG: pyridoxal phosphate-dependent aminotransferase, partial [Bdellovibrionales bacterium]|nr:pyridoxal phosphate-dependent aminotransferase [Bdellovibrionales bacterium]